MGLNIRHAILCVVSITLLAEADGPSGISVGSDRGMVRINPSEQTELDSRVRQAGGRDGMPGAWPASLIALNIEFETPKACARFQVAGVSVLTRIDRFCDVLCPSSRLSDVEASEGIRWIDVSGYANAPPRRIGPRRANLQEPEAIVRNGLTVGERHWTGKGVIVAVIDTGIDFRNPDFLTRDAQGRPESRILAFWDTFSDNAARGLGGSRAPVLYPDGAPIGTIYSRAELTEEVRRVLPTIGDWDSHGHGTACAGIAAGSGRNLGNDDFRYAGVAPEADLVSVRVGRGESLDNAFLLGAICDWLDCLAGDRPLVISCSFGATRGGRDGGRVIERQLAARYPEGRPHRAVCVAAGNDGHSPTHAAALSGERPHLLSWKADGNAPCRVSLYCTTGNPEDVRAEVVSGTSTFGPRAFVHPLTGRVLVEIRITGPGAINLSAAPGKIVAVDAYLTSDGSGAFQQDLQPARMIEEPGMSAGVITVSSYDFNDRFDTNGMTDHRGDLLTNQPLSFGALSSYSSLGIGPGDGFGPVKPDITAPGQYFVTSVSTGTDVQRDTSGRYTLFNGTSAATPYTAGVIALMFERNPDLTAGKVKGLLHLKKAVGRNLADVPNGRWGYGKLDREAVKMILEAARPPATR